MRRIQRAILLGVLSILLAGCSSVFTSSITGTVQEEQNNSSTFAGIEKVDVYAFLSESERNSAVATGTKPVSTVRIFHGISNANGTYSIPVEWNTTSSAFGKTADRVPIYLAFYHKEFGEGKLTAASEISYLSSERTNTMETETLSRSAQTYTLTMDIRNYKSGAAVQASSFLVKALASDGKTVLYSGQPTGNTISFTTTVNGVSGTVSISPSGTDTYKQCDSSGTSSSATSSFTFVKNNIVSTETTISSPLYVKEVKTTYTLNLDIQEVALGVSPSYSDLSPSYFTVTVKDASDVVLYNGNPTTNSVTFSADSEPSSAISGKVTIVPVAGDTYKQCSSTGEDTVTQNYATFTFSDTNGFTTTTTAGKLYAKAVKATYTLNLNLNEVVSDGSGNLSYQTLSPASFTVKVVRDSDSYELYNATPTGTAITFTSDAYTAFAGKVSITPVAKDTYAQCDVNGTESSDSATFSYTAKETSADATPLYAKSQQVTRTLNFSIKNIADLTGNTIIGANNFTVTVKNKNTADTKVYYSGSPANNTCSFTNVVGSDQTEYTVTFAPTDLKSYYMCSKDGGNTSDGTVSVDVTFATGKTLAEVDVYTKNLTMPQMAISGTFANTDGNTTNTKRNGCTVTFHLGTDAAGTKIGTTTTSVQYNGSGSNQTAVQGHFSYTVGSVAIPIASYTGKQFSGSIYVEISGSANATILFTNNPNDSTDKNVMVYATT
jgi:hypothetical protein